MRRAGLYLPGSLACLAWACSAGRAPWGDADAARKRDEQPWIAAICLLSTLSLEPIGFLLRIYNCQTLLLLWPPHYVGFTVIILEMLLHVTFLMLMTYACMSKRIIAEAFYLYQAP